MLDLLLLGLGTAIQADATQSAGEMQQALLTAREARERESHLMELQKTLSQQNAYFAAMGVSSSSAAQQAGQEQLRKASARQLKALRTQYGLQRRAAWQKTQGSMLGSFINFGFNAYNMRSQSNQSNQSSSVQLNPPPRPPYGLLYLNRGGNQ